MKLRISHSFFSLPVLMLGTWVTISASAQSENEYPATELRELNQNQEVNLIEDKTLSFEHDSRTAKARDSVHFHALPLPASKIKSSDQTKPSGSKEDDVLSFNFLYYIIQKFKISDLIDD
jgi:hypothetical protein